MIMDTFLNKNPIKVLDNSELKKINGGGPILEGIAWLYGFAQGRAEKGADMEITNEHRTLLGA